jgi:hypothetical protein
VQKVSEPLGVAPLTVHRRIINDGFITAERLTPGAPWQIRVINHLRVRLVEAAPAGYVTVRDAITPGIDSAKTANDPRRLRDDARRHRARH